MLLEDCYAIFELPVGASLTEVKATYRDLAQIWHPDRFQNSPRLRDKAQEKMKEVNEAYALLQQHLSNPVRPQPQPAQQKPPKHNAETCYNMGQLYRKQGRFTESVEAFTNAVNFDADHCFAHYWLASVLLRLKRYDEAVTSFKQAMRINPNDPFVYCGLGDVCLQQSHYEDALRCYQKAVEVDPTCGTAFGDMGDVYSRLNRFGDAIKAYLQAVKINPQDSSSYCGLADAYEELEIWDKAFQSYVSATRADPDNHFAFYRIAMLLVKNGELDRATDAILTALKIKPDFAPAWANLGRMRQIKRRYSDAVEAFELAIKYNLNLIMPHFEMGNIYREQGMMDKCLRYYEQASKLAPDDTRIQKALSSAYLSRHQQRF